MIKITTDSTCDLPEALLREYDITVLPLGIVMGERLYRDGADIHPADISAHVDGGGAITTTNAVNTADYLDCFRTLLKTCDAVVHVNLGSKFSSCHQNARIAAAELSNIYVTDSDNITVGMGEMVLQAARAAREGRAPEEIAALVEDLARRMEVSFVLDRLDYMKKGGRCSAVTALGANLLKLHPCIEVIDGKLGVVKKYRGSMERVAAEYLHDRLDGRTDLDTRRVWIVDSAPGSALADAARAVLQADGRFGEILESKAGCTIFSHCGPNTLGLALLRRE